MHRPRPSPTECFTYIVLRHTNGAAVGLTVGLTIGLAQCLSHRLYEYSPVHRVHKVDRGRDLLRASVKNTECMW